MGNLDFEIGNKVMLEMSGEGGEVIGIATDRDMPPQYKVEYVAATGRQTMDWFFASQITAA